MGNGRDNIIFFMCSGVGHINRGYEVHMRELFDLISDKISDTRFLLLKGAGDSSKNEKKVYCIKRNSKLGCFFKKIFNTHPPILELFTFFISSIYYIVRYKPKVIYCADYMLAAYLSKFKKVFKHEFKILFMNGNGYPPPYKHWTYTHQPLEMFKNVGDQYQFLIPHGFKTERFLGNNDSKSDYRLKLSLPIHKEIVLSVGSIDYSCKRMNYVIEEFSDALKYNDNLFLLMLGAFHEETKIIISLADELLPPDSYRILEVPYNQITNYYFASDIFCLASLKEGFGLVYIEALLSGLPVITDDNVRTREVLGEFGILKNLNQVGELSKTLWCFDYHHKPENAKQFAIKNYDWNNLINLYIDMCKAITKN